jgi:cobalt-zinc-cadmium efflux system membrane fusion protein
MFRYIFALITATLLLLPAAATPGEDHSRQVQPAVEEDHADHEHADAGAGHGESEAEENDHSDHEDHIELTPEGVTMAGITVSEAAHGRIARLLDLPGEVGFNEDRLVHISPRFAGIAVEAMARVGDYVKAGEEVAVVESNESMNAYSIKSPIDGWVIERHITPGEFVSGENSVYIVADLSTVWVNLAVYPKDAGLVRPGLETRIHAIGSDHEVEGRIDYVTPVLDVRTRSITARVVLPNPDNAWRPGTFVKARLSAGEGDEGLVVEREAVQILNEKPVIFVTAGSNRFRPVEVVTGDSDSRYTRILAGLFEGARYVSRGAFELKAKLVTSSLGGHAGHGH